MGISLECHVCVARPTRTLLCTACSLHTGPYTELPSATIPSSFFTIADRSDVRILEHLLRVRCIAYQIVRDTAYNEVRKALLVES